MNTCEDERYGGYKCDSCVFSNKESMACANPKIWRNPPEDSYYKGRDSDLTDEERISIKEHL